MDFNITSIKDEILQLLNHTAALNFDLNALGIPLGQGLQSLDLNAFIPPVSDIMNFVPQAEAYLNSRKRVNFLNFNTLASYLDDNATHHVSIYNSKLLSLTGSGGYIYANRSTPLIGLQLDIVGGIEGVKIHCVFC